MARSDPKAAHSPPSPFESEAVAGNRSRYIPSRPEAIAADSRLYGGRVCCSELVITSRALQKL